MSVRLLYLIAKHSKNDVNEHYGAIFCKQKPDVEPFMQYYSKSLSFKASWLIVLEVIPAPSISGRACVFVFIALDTMPGQASKSYYY
jgi:hypothetical protein